MTEKWTARHMVVGGFAGAGALAGMATLFTKLWFQNWGPLGCPLEDSLLNLGSGLMSACWAAAFVLKTRVDRVENEPWRVWTVVDNLRSGATFLFIASAPWLAQLGMDHWGEALTSLVFFVLLGLVALASLFIRAAEYER